VSVLSRRGGVRVSFSDGSSLDVSHELRRRYSIESGRSLDPVTLERLRFDSSLGEAEERALSFLARSLHTRSALARKLKARGFSPPVVASALSRLEELGYLDDTRAASRWVEHRLERHPEGRAALLKGLLRNGVPRDIAEEVVDAHVRPEGEIDVARRVLARLYPTAESLRALASEPERSRALSRLLTRGFSRASARAALGALGLDEGSSEGSSEVDE
jgi:regulatory protein